MYSNSSVVILQAPASLDQRGAASLLGELKPMLAGSRPRVVLDCSEIQHLDSAGVETLLCCMEEAMKRDGDVKLAGVAPSSAVILELMKVGHLFEMFKTTEEAARSFYALPAYTFPPEITWMDGTTGELEAAS
jgi:anti-anti-sigma factor